MLVPGVYSRQVTLSFILFVSSIYSRHVTQAFTCILFTNPVDSALKPGQHLFIADSFMFTKKDFIDEETRQKFLPTMATQCSDRHNSVHLIPIVRKELILDVEYGDEHDSDTVSGMNDEFEVWHTVSLFYVQVL